MPDTATARIADFASAAAIDHGDDWMITLWRGRPLYLGDLAGVLDALADACDDTERCEVCQAVSCATCGVGEPLTDCGHCPTPDCADRCGECVERYQGEAAAEVAEDVALEAGR